VSIITRSTVTPVASASRARARESRPRFPCARLAGSRCNQPGRIVDAHMQGFPADAVMAIDRPRSSAGDAVPDPGDTPELLAVDTDQLAGSLAFVTHNHWLWMPRSPANPTRCRRNG